MKLFVKIYIVLIFSLVYQSCAKPGSLSGGPRDKTPPKLDTIKSTPNYQTNFFPKEIILHFDEWITLKQKDQILISPPLNKRADISFRGKHVNLKFNEEDTLKLNTTYSINFGKSIVDFTEGNPIENLVYIFSTGDEIDSLEIKGKVISAYDNKPVKDVTVLLYDSVEDSVVVNSKPYYFSTTDKNGKFKITHIKEGYFKVFALKDGNANYLNDLETEEIGFVDTMIFIHDDSISNDIIISLFLPTPQLQILNKSIAGFGKIKIEYNRKPDSLRIIESSVKVFNKEIRNDSLIIWFDNEDLVDSINLVLKNENNLDTLIIKTRNPFEIPIPLVLNNKKKTIKLHPEKDLSLEFNQAFTIEDTSILMLYEEIILINKDTTIISSIDSINLKDIDSISNESTVVILKDTIIKELEYIVKIDSTNNRIFTLRGEWVAERTYKLMILPGYLTSLYGKYNDTIEMKLTIDKRENYSNLVCHLDSMDKTKSYIVLLKQKDKIISREIVEGIEKKELNYHGMNPGSYFLEIIEDQNKNGRWDGGDYYNKMHAEKIYTYTLNELKANWDQEEDIIINSKLKDDIKN